MLEFKSIHASKRGSWCPKHLFFGHQDPLLLAWILKFISSHGTEFSVKIVQCYKPLVSAWLLPVLHWRVPGVSWLQAQQTQRVPEGYKVDTGLWRSVVDRTTASRDSQCSPADAQHPPTSGSQSHQLSFLAWLHYSLSGPVSKIHTLQHGPYSLKYPQ